MSSGTVSQLNFIIIIFYLDLKSIHKHEQENNNNKTCESSIKSKCALECDDFVVVLVPAK